jgi:cyclic beta-1,2-glucan synthetase
LNSLHQNAGDRLDEIVEKVCSRVAAFLIPSSKEASRVKASSETIRGHLAGLSGRIRQAGVARQYAGDERPLRSELFSADQMVQHGKSLATSHKLSSERARDQLLTRLSENERVLFAVHALLADAVTANRGMTPAGEWLLDNFYLIEEQIRTAKRHLPKGYSQELPRLANGPSPGLPRVYDLALETISHGDGRVDPESLSSFVAAYQTVAALKLGELWALPIMLRLALIENLRRVGSRIAADRIDRSRAEDWADQMIETAAKDPKSLILVIADMARSNPPMVSSFVAELARRLQGQGPDLALPLTWIEQRLSESGWTIQQLVQSESRQQAADQVSMSNSIGSLRFLGGMDWREFVETMSGVEKTLREDGVYGQMNFATRDRYRHVIESVARRSRLSEVEVARAAIQLAHQSTGGNNRAAHVGFYLVDKGLPQLEDRVASRLSMSSGLRRISRRFPLPVYLGTILLISVGLAAGLLVAARSSGLDGWRSAAIGLLSLLCVSQLAVALVNWLATLLVTPHPLPRMDFSSVLKTSKNWSKAWKSAFSQIRTTTSISVC